MSSLPNQSLFVAWTNCACFFGFFGISLSTSDVLDGLTLLTEGETGGNEKLYDPVAGTTGLVWGCAWTASSRFQ
jgi:hypothetical protein